MSTFRIYEKDGFAFQTFDRAIDARNHAKAMLKRYPWMPSVQIYWETPTEFSLYARIFRLDRKQETT